MTAISVIGLGKLGACTAACFASKGFEVIGVDINKEFVDAINIGKAPVYEPRLQELISSSGARLTATQNYKEALRGSEITFLIVPTPSREDGHFSDRYLKDAFLHLSVALKSSNKKHHSFVITSTVSPGTIEKSLIPFIEANSGKKLGSDFDIAYNPEFIALGSVISDFLSPDMVLIGESSKTIGDKLEMIYNTVCDNSPHIARMSIVSAEITKISLNSYVTMKISFANTLSNICEAIDGADVDDITGALGADRRVAPYYLKGGLSYGGPCFPRDNRAFSVFAEECNVDAKLAGATDEINREQIKHIVALVLDQVSSTNDSSISVLGLAYKPNTNVIEESPGIRIIEELLKKKNIQIIAYDSLATDNAREYFGDSILYASSVRDCFEHSSVCIITTAADEFRSIDESYICHNSAKIIDCWRMLAPEKLGDGVEYICLGKAQK